MSFLLIVWRKRGALLSGSCFEWDLLNFQQRSFRLQPRLLELVEDFSRK